MTMRAFIGMGLIGAALLAAPAARADRYEVSAHSGVRWMTAESLDALAAEDGHGQAGVVASVGLDAVRPLGMTLFVDAIYDYAAVEGTTFGRVQSSLSVHSMMLGARLERPLWRAVSGWGRVSLGYATGSLSLTDAFTSSARATSDRAHGAVSTVGAGVDVAVARAERRALGVRLGFDYTRATSLAFKAAPEDGGALAIPVLSASLGELDLSGWSYQLGLYGRF
jgi:hypothetical protein